MYDVRRLWNVHGDDDCNGSHETTKKGTTENDIQKAKAEEAKDGGEYANLALACLA
jgi:hypothetical protein